MERIELDFEGSLLPFWVLNSTLDPVLSGTMKRERTLYCPVALLEAVRQCVQALGRGKCLLVDVGANLGSCSIGAGLLGARAFAFEALKDNAYVAYSNVVLHGLQGLVTVFPFGISDVSEYIPIYRNRGNSGHNMVGGYQDRIADQYTLDHTLTHRLDAVLPPLTHIHVMKMDVEGHEFKVIQSARGLTDTGSIDQVFFEFVPTILTSDFKYPLIAQQFLLYMQDVAKFKLFDELMRPIDRATLDQIALPADRNVYMQFDLYARKA